MDATPIVLRVDAAEDRPRKPAPRFHTNAMSAQGGPFDITLLFGYRLDPEEEPEVQVALTMSWEHLKVAADALQGLVAQYEREVGKIPDLGLLKEGGDT